MNLFKRKEINKPKSNTDTSDEKKCVKKREERNTPNFFKSMNDTSKQQYEFNNEEFPELINDKKEQQTNELNFKNASLKEVEILKKSDGFKEGWLYIKFDKTNNTILKKKLDILEGDNTKTIMNNFQKQKFIEKTNHSMSSIIKRHDKFIENYGIDKYYHDYKIDSYEELSEKYDDYRDYQDYEEEYYDIDSYYETDY
jgi:hypothetical protein